MAVKQPNGQTICSPRTWGWSLATGDVGGVAVLLPAHPGMAPTARV
ncbi:hypothetical protein [Streptomyces arenae]|nr:hypothetical protein [Streptomyces arenae]MCG7206408.1 hypothetical protein [Streptomyces arenae]